MGGNNQIKARGGWGGGREEYERGGRNNKIVSVFRLFLPSRDKEEILRRRWDGEEEEEEKQEEEEKKEKE